ncbi:MAG: Asp-tRNA(Asn)/Glu-tRNA(Gln) amidotransferase subunit GatC [Candidatus Dojkabacteria bacterium]|nr:Asp-tRNA(Asn)/Glu-tRNA(Gln) amidotransferase subunit GatC [Candidatus Dojkabacteria bacterium]MDQ7021630.1 Asp-tRNA(Asn)/Glu-tRNA(Gln) amidotransferase subunit GatC [Candidatus Dojkabacteria bacterium]
MNKITKEQVSHIAKLSKLDLNEEELDKYEGEFNSILSYISLIDECATDGLEFEHNLADYNGNVLRKDEVKASTLSKEKLLSNATNGRSKNGYIRVSKVIDKD